MRGACGRAKHLARRLVAGAGRAVDGFDPRCRLRRGACRWCGASDVIGICGHQQQRLLMLQRHQRHRVAVVAQLCAVRRVLVAHAHLLVVLPPHLLVVLPPQQLVVLPPQQLLLLLLLAQQLLLVMLPPQQLLLLLLVAQQLLLVVLPLGLHQQLALRLQHLKHIEASDRPGVRFDVAASHDVAMVDLAARAGGGRRGRGKRKFLNIFGVRDPKNTRFFVVGASRRMAPPSPLPLGPPLSNTLTIAR